MHDIVSAKFDYSTLDREGAPVRIRLNSIALHVRHLGDPKSAKQVEITYGRDGVLSRVRGRQCVMACYNAIIPHLCPEFPEKQKEANEKAQKELKEMFKTIKAYAKARDENKNQLVDLRWEAMRPVLKGDVPLYIHADDYRQLEQAIHFAKKEQLSIVLVSARDADKAIDLITAFRINSI